MGREGHHAKIFRQTFISHSNFAHLKPLNKKYITFSPEAVIPIDSLRWICETADDLIALAKAEGIDMTKEEAEAYMAELADVELDEEVLQKVAGGKCWDINHRLT